MAKEASISSEAFRDPDTPIHAVAVARFLENAAAVLNCEAFGLRLGQLQDLSLFGPLWSFFQSATTVGELVHDLATYFPLHTQGAILAIAPAPHGVMLTYDVAADIAQRLGYGAVRALETGAHDVMTAWDAPGRLGEPTEDPSVTLVPLVRVLEESERLLDGTSPVVQRRIALLEQAQELLAF